VEHVKELVLKKANALFVVEMGQPLHIHKKCD
jgi:hypothetical protein